MSGIHRFAPRSGPPAPVAPKALAVPLDHSGSLHQRHCFEATRPHPVEPHPDQPIDGAQPQTARPLSIEDRNLMTKGDELEFQFRPTAKPTGQPGKQRRDECEHAGDITDRSPNSPDFLAALEIFSRHRWIPSHPDPFTLRGRDLVSYPLSGDLTFELSK